MKNHLCKRKKQVFAMLMAFVLMATSLQPAFTAEAGNEKSVQESGVYTTLLSDLKTNDLVNPVGIDANPTFSWKMQSEVTGQLQKTYQIQVAEDAAFSKIIWDSGKQEEDRSVGIGYSGTEILKASTTYYWRVTVTDKDNKEIMSPTASFEMGLMGNEGWNQSQWIQVGTSNKQETSQDKKTDYVIEADIEIVNNSVSLLVDTKDKQNYLLWQFNNNNGEKSWVFKPHAVTNGTNYKTLREINVNEYVKKEVPVQHIKVHVTGSEITTYLNDHEIASIPASEAGGIKDDGTIGLLGFRSHEIDREAGWMDNITITDFSDDPNGVMVKNYNFDDGQNPFDLGTVVDGRLSTSYISGETISMEKRETNEEGVHYQVAAEVTCETNAVSLLFNGIDSNSFYMFQLNTKDEPGKVLFKPHTWNNGAIATYPDHNKDVSAAVGAAEDLKNTPVSVLIDVTDQEIKTYLNEVLVDTFPISSSKGIKPQAGLLGMRAVEEERGSVDNFRLTDYSDGNKEGTVLYDYDFENGNPFLNGEVVDGKLISYGLGILFPPQGVSTFRKGITPKANLVSAKLYTAGLGVFDVFVDGERVGTRQEDGSVIYDELKPGYTHFQKRTTYYTYDVTGLFQSEKESIISANVTSGWWNGRVAGNAGKKEAFRAQLLLTYADGKQEVIGTDKTWKTSLKGPVLSGDIYDGETFDANADVSYRISGYDDSGWNYADQNLEFQGEISPQVGPSIRVRNDLEITPKSAVVYNGAEGADNTKYGKIHVTGSFQNGESFVLKAGETAVFNMGQNFAGWDEITAEGEKGTILTMRHGEMLNDRDGLKSRGNDGPEGSLYTDNLRTAKATGRYIMSGTGVESYHATATFYGFQYVEVTTTKDVTIHSMKGIVVTSVADDTGKISTSNEDVNQLISNIFWGQYSNYLSTATDCPQRDERKGWTADTQVFSTAAAYNADSKGFLMKYMDDMNDSQVNNENDIYDGAYPDTAPYNGYGEIGQLGWGDAGIIIPYNLYKMYGDKTVIEDSYENMKKFMDVFMKSTNKWGGGHNHGDWLSYENNDNDVQNGFGIAYYAWDAQMMAEMAEVIGRTEDVEKYQAIYEEEKEFFQQNFVNEDGSLRRTEQTLCLMALKMDLLPDDQSKELVKQALLDNIKRNGNKLQTGFLGTAIIMQTLSEIGATDVAYQLLLQDGNPSWLYSVDQGATTIWERWNSYTVEGGFGPVSMNSFNHYAYGAVAEWMYGYMAGIMYDTKNPGFKHIILQPSPDPSLQNVDCSYESAYGTIVSNWNYEQEGFFYHASIPANTTATVYIPLEKGKTLSVNGKSYQEVTKEKDGLKYIETKDGKAVFEAVAGTYEFLAQVTKYFTVSLEKSSDIAKGFVSIDGKAKQGLPSSIRLEEGKSVTIKAMFPENDIDYTFTGWSGDVTSKQAEITIKPEKNMNLTANFKWVGGENLAHNKKVSSSNGWDVESWSHANLVDGILTSEPGSLGYTTNQYNTQTLEEPDWIEIDLGEDMEFDRIQLYPRTDSLSVSGTAANFPKDFSFEVRGAEEEEYRTISSNQDQSASIEKPKVYEFEKVTARYVRLSVTSLGEPAAADPGFYFVQLAEMGIYKKAEIPEIVVERVKITPESANVDAGGTKQFFAEVIGQNIPEQAVKWSVEGNASKETQISQTGMLTVGKDETAKSLTVKAVSVLDPEKSAAAVVAVIRKAEPPKDVKVSKITVKAGRGSIFEKEKMTLSAVVYPENAKNKNVVWTSSDSRIASVDAKGNVTGKKAGTVTMTASATDGSRITGKCVIKVVKPTIKLNASSIRLQRKKSTSALQAGGLKSGDKIKSWTSSNKSVATVNKSGKITAKKAGSTLITVSTIKGAKAVCRLKVITGEVKTVSLKVNADKIRLKKGQKFQLKVQRLPITATDKITYSVSDKKIVSVSSKGKITAKKKGSATITIKSRNGKQKKVRVYVK